MSTIATTTVRCDRCEQLNRVAAAATGIPRCGNCHAALPWIVDADDRTFADLAEKSTPLVLVDMHATWCAPCRLVSPALEQIAHEYAEKMKLVRVDIDNSPELSHRFSIQAVPTLLLLRQGKIVARQSGALPVPALRQWVESALHATTGSPT